MNNDEFRYSRQIVLSGVGDEGQQKLGNAKVLVTGAGGLGCPVLQYLAGAGVGTIGIVDYDKVSFSNLHRQPLFMESDVGKNKAVCAAEKLSTLNSNVRLHSFTDKLTSKNIRKIIHEFEIIIDCSDNIATRYLISDACTLINKPHIYGALHRFTGQAAVFNFENGPGYRDIYPVPPSNEPVDCEAAGVLGPIAGIIGCIQATETIKIITGFGSPSSGTMIQINTRDWSFNNWKFKRDVANYQNVPQNWEELELLDYDKLTASKSVLVDTNNWLSKVYSNNTYHLIDVRETWEADNDPVPGALNIPVSLLRERTSGFERSHPLLVICETGKRSRIAKVVLKELGFVNVHHFEGGVNSWKRRFQKAEQ